jgi:hypothetical protein
VSSVDIETLECFGFEEEGLVDLEMLFFDVFIREKEPCPGSLSLDERLGQYFMNSQGTTVILCDFLITVE